MKEEIREVLKYIALALLGATLLCAGLAFSVYVLHCPIGATCVSIVP